ncbi:MAG: hypothetical protein KF691_03485 [Phycisphaeraceae bacterium]|nr:hypothetical protein [Phycisphaeraceae bacterium]
MAKGKSASEMSLSELEAALKGAKEKIQAKEQELADYRKSVHSYVLEFGKRQRQLERDFGMVPASSLGGRKAAGNHSGHGAVTQGILAVLGNANKPVTVNQIVEATRASSKPSVAQAIMKLVKAGKVHRYNKDGKTIPKGDDSQRAKAYALA